MANPTFVKRRINPDIFQPVVINDSLEFVRSWVVPTNLCKSFHRIVPTTIATTFPRAAVLLNAVTTAALRDYDVTILVQFEFEFFIVLNMFRH
jgi:hypothetical protein